MEQAKHSQLKIFAVRRLRELLIGFFIITGVILIILSQMKFISSDWQIVLRSLGLSLAPGGVVAWILTRYASRITEMLLREAVEQTIKDRIQEDMSSLETTVHEGIKSINAVVTQGIIQFGKELENLSPLFFAASKLGLENVFLTRGIALSSFAWFLDAETHKSNKNDARVWLVSSSIKGFLEATSEYFDGKRMMEKIANCGCELRIMMTDPNIADLRAKQEQRAEGEIPNEVIMNIAYLKRIGVKRECLRFYSGTPTVFAIATSDRMLLNPYPYQTEAFRCFSVVVHKTLNPESDIFNQYLRYHFEEPWNHQAIEIPFDRWNKL